MEADELEELCRREYPRLVGTLSLYCGDPATAEELAQEVLWRACRSSTQLQGMQAPGAWMHRVGINLAKSQFRRWAAERKAMARVAARTRTVVMDADSGDAVDIRRAVSGLPSRQREALVLRYYLDWPVEAVADALDVTPAAARQLVHRAMTALRAEFGPQLAKIREEVRNGT